MEQISDFNSSDFSYQIQRIVYAMSLFGVGEVVGGLGVGIFIDKYGSKKAVFINMSVILVAVAFTLAEII